MSVRSLTEIRNKKCSDCKLCNDAEFVCLPGYGNDRAKIMLIGEAPGHREDDSGVPFVGKAGKVLDVILEELGLSRDEVYITNIVHCRPKDNGTPKMDQMRECRKYLVKEINIVKPKIIITLGNCALKGFFNDNGLSAQKVRGRILERKGRYIIPTYHPAAALRNRYYATLIFEDIREGLKKVKNGLTKPSTDYTMITKDRLKEILGYMDDYKIVSFDTETTGFDMFDKELEITSIQIGVDTNKAYMFNVKGFTPKEYQLIWDYLNSRDLVVGHNIKFDIKWSMRYGFNPVVKVWDTLIAHHLLDENYPNNELKHLAPKYSNIGEQLAVWETEVQKIRNSGRKPTADELLNYGCGDADATLQLYDVFRERLDAEDLTPLMEGEMRVLKTLARMEFFGFKIDLPMFHKLKKEYGERVEKSRATVTRVLGNININSTKQLANTLYGKGKGCLGLEVVKKTDTGQPSCDEASLLALAPIVKREKNEKGIVAVEALLEYRRVDKLYRTYLLGLEKNGLIKYDGKLHTNFKQLTVTGRLSSSEPNLQQNPREGDIKKMFISSFKDGRIVKGDYSQIELRILAHYADDKYMIEAFSSGRDIHREVAAKVFRKPADKVTEQERKFTKQVNFGIIYKISPSGLADKLGCSYKRAFRLIEDWFKEFPTARRWISKTELEVQQNGFVTNIFGRKRRFIERNPSSNEGRASLREGVNSPIQGSAGDITKRSMYRLDKELREKGMESRVVCNVHDEVVVDCTRKEVPDVVRMMRTIFTNPPVKLRVPLDVEIKVGKSWGEMKEVTNA